MNILNPAEIKVLMMAIDQTIEDVEAVSKNPTMPFDPRSRKDMKDILEAAKSARAKLEKVTGFQMRLDPYEEGDEFRKEIEKLKSKL